MRIRDWSSDVCSSDLIPTHCPEQIFHFDAKGLLRRLDYHSEVVNSVPTAHYLYDHANFSGLVMPTRRKALPRLPDGRSAPGPVFVDLGYSNFRLECHGAGPFGPAPDRLVPPAPRG